MFQEARERVVNLCLSLADKGFLAGTGGNIALRADEKHFVVTPSATDYYAMGAGHVCVMRISDLRQLAGDRKASVEAGLHAGVLRARPDCAASVHTHQPIASAYTLLGIPLAVRRDEVAQQLGRTVPCVPYAPSGTGWLARLVARAFDGTTHACLMRNHGVVCVGERAEEAVERIELLEAVCADFFRAGLGAASGAPATAAALVKNTLDAVRVPTPQP